MLTVKVTVDLSRFKRFTSDIDDGLRNPASAGPVRRAMKRWGVRYRSFAQERFDIFSKGGGDWPPLKPATIAARRKGPKRTKTRKRLAVLNKRLAVLSSKQPKRGQTIKHANKLKRLHASIAKAKKSLSAPTAAILRDKGILFAVLAPQFTGQPGAIEISAPFSIIVGYGGSHGHPGSKRATIADIASYHNDGRGHLPVRRIIVPPPSNVQSQMADDLREAVHELAKQS